jgi:hypothetical protein
MNTTVELANSQFVKKLNVAANFIEIIRRIENWLQFLATLLCKN